VPCDVRCRLCAPGPRYSQPTWPGQYDALAVHGATLTIWRPGPPARAWHAAEWINVPIPLGSSS
jgi:hypothetical protein